mmetsp:Transcript_12889/g.20855  ORF Transcript_12889/g.20855 Transcript_12889/m.20855 type:complete len:642 (+) Transcript_12889:132-2057(+)
MRDCLGLLESKMVSIQGENVYVTLDGESLTVEQLVLLSQVNSRIKIAGEAWEEVKASRAVVDQMLDKRTVAYGINTGFGLFSNVVIDEDKLELLQRNLIRSHSAGVGEPLPYERTRMLLALRINVLCRGNSGVSIETLTRMVASFNAGCISIVPCQGTVGASGDLAPLSHLALGLMGEGLMWDPSSMSKEDLAAASLEQQKLLKAGCLNFDKSLYTFKQRSANEVLSAHGLDAVELKAKEGLALINGTQLICAIGSEATFRARNVQRCADIVCAMTLEVLKGTVSAFHPRIHERRPHTGQGIVAARLRALLHPGAPSELYQSHLYCGRVQDAYSLRCTPQIHGIASDTINFVESILEVELNSSTDNPMVFTGSAEVTEVENDGEVVHVWPPRKLTKRASTQVESHEDPETLDEAKAEIKRLKESLNKKNSKAGPGKRQSDTFYETGKGFVISGGNFHGEYPAKALDYLAIGISEIASVSERRLERMVNPQLSGLPAFLVADGGLNSGFMIAHCTSAALVSENKVLCHPSSVDSISTSGAKEDHVSMGGMSARKALQVVENVERVVAIELLAASQALDLHRPLKTTPALEALHALVRTVANPWDADRIMNTDIDEVTQLIRSGKVWKTVQPFLVDFKGTAAE